MSFVFADPDLLFWSTVRKCVFWASNADPRFRQALKIHFAFEADYHVVTVFLYYLSLYYLTVK